MPMFQVIQSDEFKKWLGSLKDLKAKTIIDDRLVRIAEGNFGDAKPVGDGISEARIHYGAGYRLYFMKIGNLLVVMLAGGDKSSQTRDINKAKKLANDWR